MTYVQQITKIRNKDQLTVPKKVRDALERSDGEVIVKIEILISKNLMDRFVLDTSAAVLKLQNYA